MPVCTAIDSGSYSCDCGRGGAAVEQVGTNCEEANTLACLSGVLSRPPSCEDGDAACSDDGAGGYHCTCAAEGAESTTCHVTAADCATAAASACP